MKTTLLVCTFLGLAAAVDAGPNLPGVIYKTGTPKKAPDSMLESGVTCDKCRTTWVLRADSTCAAPELTAFSDQKTGTCPHCVKSARRYFKSGKLPRPCKHCGGAMTGACANLLEDTRRATPPAATARRQTR